MSNRIEKCLLALYDLLDLGEVEGILTIDEEIIDLNYIKRASGDLYQLRADLNHLENKALDVLEQRF